MNHWALRMLLGGSIAIAAGGISAPGSVHASIPAVATSVSKAILKYFGKQGAEEATEYLGRSGGKEIVERVVRAATKEGGDEAVERVAVLTRKYGPEALAALDNAPSIVPVITALDEIPVAQVPAALARLSAGASGRELARTIGQFGSAALRSELKHPGVGMLLVRSLGDEGADLASRLNSEQAIAVGRHAESLANLPAAQRQGVLALVREDTERMVAFFGRFVEANPGKTLFTVATTTVILAEPDRILGGDDVVFDADGNPIVVSKSGLVGRSIQAGGSAAEHVSRYYLQPIFYVVMAFAITFAVLWGAIKLWHAHRREQTRTRAIRELAEPASKESESARS